MTDKHYRGTGNLENNRTVHKQDYLEKQRPKDLWHSSGLQCLLRALDQ